MGELAVATFDLTRRYGRDVLAVDHVDLRVAAGEIYGFLGLNGAGKSTTIRLLLGMIGATEGRAELLGQRVRPESPVWRRVGHLVESATAYPELSVRENLEVARRLRGIGDRRVVDRAIERLGLSEYVDRRAGTLSLGNLQRLALARALLHGPDLLILDEPANGLDPAGVVEVRELLRSLAREHGTTIFMSSHILGEVDRLATRIGIVHRGRLLEELDSDTLERYRDIRLEVGARDIEAAEAALRSAGLAPVRSSAGMLELREPRALEAPDGVARLLVEAASPPTHLALARETLEDHFMRLVAGDAPATDGPPATRREAAA
jgi:ABC-2 type transport system ATP-binding protein